MIKLFGLPAGAAFVAASALAVGYALAGQEKDAGGVRPAPAQAMFFPGAALKPCNAADTQPKIAFLVKLTGNLDIRNIQAVIKEMDANATYPNGNPNTERNPPPPSNPTTKLDLNLNLTPGAGTVRHRARIVVQLEDSTIKFRDGKLAINSLDSNGPDFLCYRSSTDKMAIVDAVYKNAPSGPRRNYGTMNINLIVPDVGGTYILPISLDPEIKNNG